MLRLHLRPKEQAPKPPSAEGDGVRSSGGLAAVAQPETPGRPFPGFRVVNVLAVGLLTLVVAGTVLRVALSGGGDAPRAARTPEADSQATPDAAPGTDRPLSAAVAGAWAGRLVGGQDASSVMSVRLAIESVDARGFRSGSITLRGGACTYLLGLPRRQAGGVQLTVGPLERPNAPGILCDQDGSQLLVTPRTGRQVGVRFVDARTGTVLQGRLRQAPA
jgi:hypothetical protein